MKWALVVCVKLKELSELELWAKSCPAETSQMESGFRTSQTQSEETVMDCTTSSIASSAIASCVAASAELGLSPTGVCLGLLQALKKFQN